MGGVGRGALVEGCNCWWAKWSATHIIVFFACGTSFLWYWMFEFVKAGSGTRNLELAERIQGFRFDFVASKEGYACST